MSRDVRFLDDVFLFKKTNGTPDKLFVHEHIDSVNDVVECFQSHDVVDGDTLILMILAFQMMLKNRLCTLRTYHIFLMKRQEGPPDLPGHHYGRSIMR